MHATTDAAPWSEDVLNLAVEVLRLLAEPTRLQIAGLLLDAECSVTQLAEKLEKPAPGISQHLAKMRMAKIVNTRREGTTIYYRIDDSHVRQLITDTVGHVEHMLDSTLNHRGA